ncbi:MAG: hypothetical protein RI883_1120 [Bacteroidota bacterium]|jgi:outer membrane protein W
MKKLAILVGAIVLTSSAFAQRPTDSNPFSLEGGLSLNSAANTFSSPTLRLRYFAAENIAVRLGIQYNSSKTTDLYYGLNSAFVPTVDSTGTEINKAAMTWISIGGSYHFSQLERLDPYVALDVMIGMGSTSAEWTDFDGTGFDKGFNATGDSKTSGLGIGIGAGFDYYFAENVFIGAELGMTYMSNNDKGGTWSSTTGGVTTSGENLTTGKSSSFGNSANAAIRLGWRF